MHPRDGKSDLLHNACTAGCCASETCLVTFAYCPGKPLLVLLDSQHHAKLPVQLHLLAQQA